MPLTALVAAFLFSTAAHTAGAPAAAAPVAAAQEPAADSPPRPTGTVTYNQGVYEGYTLLAPIRSTSTYLLDPVGDVVHVWESDRPPGVSVYLLDDGSLLRTKRLDENPRFHGGGLGGGVRRIDWDGRVLWDYTLSDDARVQHHDVEPLPNGNVLMIVWEHVPKERALALGRDAEVLDDEGLWALAVHEVKPVGADGGELVWRWSVLDHLVQDRDAELAGWGAVPDHPGRVDVNATHRDRPPLTEEQRKAEEELLARMEALGYAGGAPPKADEPAEGERPRGFGPDWLHANSIDWHPEHDLVLLSVPRMGELWVIDHSTTTEEARGTTGGRRGKGGELLWRWGNPRTYGRGTDADQRLFGQHDAQWLAGERADELRVLVFNNGGRRPDGDHSSVDELVLPFHPQRGFELPERDPYGPRELAWTWHAEDPATFFAPFISGCQRLPNGNTLAVDGPQGRIVEVTPDARIVWDHWNVLGGDAEFSFGGATTDQQGTDMVKPFSLFRATKVSPDHPALHNRDLTPQRR